jgi:alpha-tubulin suppressor-like RCC1 family protein
MRRLNIQKISIIAMGGIVVIFYCHIASCPSANNTDTNISRKRHSDFKKSNNVIQEHESWKGCSFARGLGHICVVDEKRELWCWGDNEYGQVTTVSSSKSRSSSSKYAFVKEYKQVKEIGPVISIVSGIRSNCALNQRGEVHCWGCLGDVRNKDQSSCYNGLTLIPNSDRVTQVVKGISHTCALLESGVVECWKLSRVKPKRNTEEKSDCESYFTPKPERVKGLDNVIQLASQHEGTCALRQDGEVYCWGRVIPENFISPTIIRSLPPTSKISSGISHTCAISKLDGSVWCWGWNNSEQLAIPLDMKGQPHATYLPIKIPEIKDAVSLACADFFTCALSREHNVYCWGSFGMGGVSYLNYPDPFKAQDSTTRSVSSEDVKKEGDEKKILKPVSPIYKINFGQPVVNMMASGSGACFEMKNGSTICTWTLGPNAWKIGKKCPNIRFGINSDADEKQ